VVYKKWSDIAKRREFNSKQMASIHRSLWIALSNNLILPHMLDTFGRDFQVDIEVGSC
jgi:hypothetical protein